MCGAAAGKGGVCSSPARKQRRAKLGSFTARALQWHRDGAGASAGNSVPSPFCASAVTLPILSGSSRGAHGSEGAKALLVFRVFPCGAEKSAVPISAPG